MEIPTANIPRPRRLLEIKRRRREPFQDLDRIFSRRWLLSGVFGARNSVFSPETGGPVIGSGAGGDWNRGPGDRPVPLVEEV